MPPRIIASRVVVQDRLPDLEMTTSHTENSAIHKTKFVGTLEQWTTFETSVRLAFDIHDWGRHRAQLELRPAGRPSPASLLREHTAVGHEGGVDGRWKQHVVNVMGAVFKDQLHPPDTGLQFGDFKASTTAYRKEPDVACFDTVTGAERVIGEFKVPWVKEHKLSFALRELREGKDEPFRKIVGDIHSIILRPGVHANSIPRRSTGRVSEGLESHLRIYLHLQRNGLSPAILAEPWVGSPI